jgi:uncharacterized protein (TIGR03435 family)
MLKHPHIEEVFVFAAKPNRRSNHLLLAFACACAWIAIVSPMAFAQTGAASSPALTMNATPAPAFDVATIRPHAGMLRMGLRYQPDGFTGTVTLYMLVQYAYGTLTEDQITGAPDWVKTDWFDIQAKMSATDFAETQKLSSDESNARRKLMMQALLAERFKLKVHPAIKQLPVYELVLAKSASKLIDSATDTNPKLDRGEDGKPRMGIKVLSVNASIVEGYSMTAWAGFLSQPVCKLGRPVLDKTGLTGTYDFPINWSVYMNDPALQEDEGAIFGALKEVGLQLHPATGPIDTLVIDHIEKPTEN